MYFCVLFFLGCCYISNILFSHLTRKVLVQVDVQYFAFVVVLHLEHNIPWFKHSLLYYQLCCLFILGNFNLLFFIRMFEYVVHVYLSSILIQKIHTLYSTFTSLIVSVTWLTTSLLTWPPCLFCHQSSWQSTCLETLYPCLHFIYSL